MTSELDAPVGNLVLQKPDGSEVRLRDYLGRPLVLIFLRHLA